MAALRRIAGISSFFHDGAAMPAKGSCEWQPTSTKREPIVGMNGRIVGWSETGEPAYISLTLLNTGAFRVQDLFDRTNVQLVLQLANGVTVTGHSMTVMDPIKVTVENAEFAIKWVGPSVEENV